MSNSEFQFNFMFKLHKSNLSIGLKDDDYPSLSVAYGVPLDEVMSEVETDDRIIAEEATLLIKNHPEAKAALHGKRIAFLGDSNTSNRRSYLNIIRKAMDGENVAFHDDSISAYKLLDIITNYVPTLRDFHADVAHVMIGSNDMKHTTDGKCFQLVEPEEFRRQLRYLLKSLTDFGTTMIISTLPPFDAEKIREKFFSVNVGYSEEIRIAFNDVIREEAHRAGCILNDMEQIFAEYETAVLTQDDGLHLNQLGQRLMANAVLEKLTTACADRK